VPNHADAQVLQVEGVAKSFGVMPRYPLSTNLRDCDEYQRQPPDQREKLSASRINAASCWRAKCEVDRADEPPVVREPDED